MARYLFITNQHPTESFSTKVALKTAELLRRAGHEVIIEKTNPRKTPFGRVLLTGKALKHSQRLVLEGKTWRHITEMEEKLQPVNCFRFHCTPSTSSIWTNKGDYFFKPDEFEIDAPAIEIKAEYARLPKGARKRLARPIAQMRGQKFVNKHYRNDPRMKHFKHDTMETLRKYFTQTTNIQLSRRTGLHPELIAVEIAAELEPKLKPQMNLLLKEARAKVDMLRAKQRRARALAQQRAKQKRLTKAKSRR